MTNVTYEVRGPQSSKPNLAGHHVGPWRAATAKEPQLPKYCRTTAS